MFDTLGTGSMTRDYFLLSTQELTDMIVHDKEAIALFRMLDLDSKGSLNTAELSRGIKQMLKTQSSASSLNMGQNQEI